MGEEVLSRVCEQPGQPHPGHRKKGPKKEEVRVRPPNYIVFVYTFKAPPRSGGGAGADGRWRLRALKEFRIQDREGIVPYHLFPSLRELPSRPGGSVRVCWAGRLSLVRDHVREENSHNPQRWVRQSVAWSGICGRALAEARVVGGLA